MAKTINDIVEGYCKKGLPPVKIFRLMKRFVSRGGVYKAVKRFRETGSLLQESEVLLKNPSG